MIEYAKRHHESQDFPLQFQQCDIMKTINVRQIFPDGYDKIFSFYCLHWIKDHR